MNRLLLIFLLSIASMHCMFGQNNTYNLHGFGGSRHIQVLSFNGKTSESAYLMLLLESQKMKQTDWKITAKVTSMTPNFPANMLSFIYVSKGGTSNVTATNGFSYPLSLNNEVEILNFMSSNQDGYQNLNFNFNLQVQGGNYLRDFPRWTTVKFDVEYRLYTNNGKKEEKMIKDTAGEIFLNIDPDSQVPVYSITVLPDVFLEFNTIDGYMNGITKNYDKGLKVASTGNYEVRVKSHTSQFTSTTSSRTLPLDLVSLQLGGGNGTQQPVNISTENQLILQGASTNGNVVEYDMIYKAKPIEDQYLIINNQETFTTQLMFEMTTN